MKTIKAKKSLGQNFLIDEEALTDIARSIEIAGKHIIEVWPGYGALTEYLLSHHPASLDMVELDPDMVKILDERFMTEQNPPVTSWHPPLSRGKSEQYPLGRLPLDTGGGEDFVPITPITIHHMDVLTYNPPYEDYSVIANIPYYITSPILFHFLYPQYTASRKWWELNNGGSGVETVWDWWKTENRWAERTSFSTPETFDTFGHKNMYKSPMEMTIMMQEEVGEKILEWRAKKRHHSYLSLAMELACEDIEIVRYVGRDSFDPAPKVDSIVLKFTVKSSRDREIEARLLALWRVAFTHPRKTLISNLKGSQYDIDRVKSWIRECGYDEKIRAEAVGMEEWKLFIEK